MTEKVILENSVSIHGNETKEIELRRPTVGDEEDAMQMAVNMKRGQNSLTMELCLFSRLTGIKYDDLRAMNDTDYTRLREALVKINGLQQNPI